MRPIVLLAPLLLLQCGPGAPDADGSTTDGTVTTTGGTTGDTTGNPTGNTTDLVTTSTSSDATTTDATTEPTTDATTTAGGCRGRQSGIVWVCACETNLGPWTPFNEACDKQERGAVEWTEWLCSEYAEDDLGNTTGAGTTGTGTTGDSSTGADTDTAPLNCQCTCEMTVDCCDDSIP